MPDELIKAIDENEIGNIKQNDKKETCKILHDNFGWDLYEARKIWCFGPDEAGPNILVDKT